jgi:hypothetical protein
VHHADQQAAQGKPPHVLVIVAGLGMGSRLSGVGVGVQVDPPVGVAVDVDVNPVAGEAVEQLPAEKHEHCPHRHLEPAGQRRADGVFGQDDRAGEGAERRHVAEAPDDAVADDAAPRAVARREAGQRRQVVGLHGVLQAQEKPNEENGDHDSAPPNSDQPAFTRRPPP